MITSFELQPLTTSVFSFSAMLKELPELAVRFTSIGKSPNKDSYYSSME